MSFSEAVQKLEADFHPGEGFYLSKRVWNRRVTLKSSRTESLAGQRVLPDRESSRTENLVGQRVKSSRTERLAVQRIKSSRTESLAGRRV